jgi:hypothetical protein
MKRWLRLRLTRPGFAAVIASQRVGAKRRPMTGSAKQSILRLRKCGWLRRGACHRARIRATRWLLAMTRIKRRPYDERVGRIAYRNPPFFACEMARLEDAGEVLRRGGLMLQVTPTKSKARPCRGRLCILLGRVPVITIAFFWARKTRRVTGQQDCQFSHIAGGGCNDGSIRRDPAGPPQPRPRCLSLHIRPLGICSRFADRGLFVFVIRDRGPAPAAEFF